MSEEKELMARRVFDNAVLEVIAGGDAFTLNDLKEYGEGEILTLACDVDGESPFTPGEHHHGLLCYERMWGGKVIPAPTPSREDLLAFRDAVQAKVDSVNAFDDISANWLYAELLKLDSEDAKPDAPSGEVCAYCGVTVGLAPGGVAAKTFCPKCEPAADERGGGMSEPKSGTHARLEWEMSQIEIHTRQLRSEVEIIQYQGADHLQPTPSREDLLAFYELVVKKDWRTIEDVWDIAHECGLIRRVCTTVIPCANGHSASCYPALHTMLATPRTWSEDAVEVKTCLECICHGSPNPSLDPSCPLHGDGDYHHKPAAGERGKGE